MANLVDGKISHEPIARLTRSGEFDRPDSAFRGQILSRDAEAHRFHLYVSYACPWAHRTLITRALKNLEPHIDISVTDAYMGDKGWTFSKDPDPKYLAVLYVATRKDYTGKISVPVLWDKKEKRIVNNESSEIIRMLNESFNHITHSDIDLYPESMRDEINRVNDLVYEDINNGVYKTGFAGSQKAYDKAFDQLFRALDKIDNLLGQRPYLAGDYFTEADIRVFTTLIRFDVVYVGHFKCNKKRISEYSNLQNYLKQLYQYPDIKKTCHFDHIKEHYYRSHPMINPTGIIPKGPELDLESSHNRGEVNFFRVSLLQEQHLN
jgi:putative glutathione S-transferase